MSVQVVAALSTLPEQRRHRFDLVETATIAEIVARALPGAPEAVLARTRVAVMRGTDLGIVPRAHWARVRPRAGSIVVIRLAPGEFFSSVAAWLTAQVINVTGITTLGFSQAVYIASYAVVATAVSAALNALIPVPELPGQRPTPEQDYAVTGWQNQAAPGQAIPFVMGRVRVAPLFAMRPYTEIVGDDQFVRALFAFGYGRLDISAIRIGQRPIEEFGDLEYELREGIDTDDDVTLTPFQVIEEPTNLELVGPQEPLDDAGNPTSGDREEQPVVLATAQGAVRASIILHWPGGLAFFKSNGDLGNTDVDIRIRQRQPGGAWQDVDELRYAGRTVDPFFRQFTWALPSRGRWEIEITNLQPLQNGTKRSNRTFLAALQSFRPEYPLNTGVPLALLSMRIRASRQLSGTLNQVNALVSRYARDWTGTAWVEAQTRNPASAFVLALSSPANAYPVPDTGIDWDTMQDWHAFCVEKGLHYDRDHRDDASLRDVLNAIAAAGRASVRHDGARWSVVIDRPQAFAVDHVSPRNAAEIAGSRAYVERPDGIRVRFRDSSNDFEEAERVIRWPGHEGSIDVTEQWDLRGKTDPAEVAREIYRRIQEVELRRDRWTCMQDGLARVATRGDTVLLSSPVIVDGQASGRVLAVDGKSITLDALVTMEAGQTYAVRFLDYDAGDTVGGSVLTAVATVPGETRTLLVTGDAVPPASALVLFGQSGTETIPCRVIDIEPGENDAVRLTLTNDAPEIDSLTDAYVAPAWDPAVGEATDALGTAAAPVFRGISAEGEEGSYGTTARSVIVAASADPADTVPLAAITVHHRIVGAGTWSEATIPGGSGSVALSYALADEIEIELEGVDYVGGAGARSAAITYTVADTDPLPAALDLGSLDVAGAIGHAVLSLAHSDPNTDSIAVFRTPSGDALDTGADRVRVIPVASGATIVSVDGDSTRAQVLSGGMFGDAATWTAGGGWAIAGGQATHTPGAASTLSQSFAFTAGVTYRGYVTVTGRTAGSITVQLAGGTAVPTPAIAADGQTLFALDAITGNDRIEIVATSDFDGAVDEILLIRETAATAPQGAQDYRFAAVNAAGVGSAPTAAITVTII